MRFQGFSDETFEFFMAIRFNNNREFFQANRDWYLRAVREPALRLAEALGPAVEALDDGLERRPNRVVSRINRDVRFTNDKSPYRDHIWLAFRRPAQERTTTLAAYFEITDRGGTCGVGFYGENRPLMDALRRDMLVNPGTMLALAAGLEGEFALYGDAFRRMRVPPELPEALVPWYLKKGLYLEKEIPQFSILKSESLADVVGAAFARLTPVYRYIANLTPMEEDADFLKHAAEKQRGIL